MACLNTGSGVWMKIEANVPTTTIMKAAADNRAWMPAPLSTGADQQRDRQALTQNRF